MKIIIPSQLDAYKIIIELGCARFCSAANIFSVIFPNHMLNLLVCLLYTFVTCIMIDSLSWQHHARQVAPRMQASRGAGVPPVPPSNAVGAALGADLMAQFGLSGVLADMRKRKMRSSFANFVADVRSDVIPIKARCPKGSLVEIARMPANEDVRRLEPFDERVLRNALTLKESGEKPKLPDWLNEEVPLGEDEQRKKRRDKKKRKKKKKRRREGADGADGEDGLDDDERRLKRKRKKKHRESAN